MIRLCIAGVTGNVGRGLARAVAKSDDVQLVAAVARRLVGRSVGDAIGEAKLDATIAATIDGALATPFDVLVDFTRADAVKRHVLAAVARGVHVVVGTSGLGDADYAEIDAAARAANVGVFAAGNFAITAVLLQRFARLAAEHLPSWEIIDYAYDGKPDAPSGTARELAAKLSAVRAPHVARPVAETLGEKAARGATLGGAQLHSVRLGGFASSAEVIFGLPGERLTIRHDAIDKTEPYVGGAMLAIRKVAALRGVVRGLDQLL
jgi:4-hydroxy-tetrahydrodipicolinate reductase